MPFLDTGIADILANATHGLGVVLEHRYYGKKHVDLLHATHHHRAGESIPVPDLTTDSLRWLNNAQSLADSAYFMRNVNFSASLFPQNVSPAAIANLTAPNTPWIYYGGSYAGARAAHMRVLYPEIVFGAISSSGVTHATINNWEYMDVIRTGAPSKCSELIQSSMTHIDTLVVNPIANRPLKALFGLQGIEHDDDFVSVVSWPLSAFQGKNWDPEVGESAFDNFCAALIGDEEAQTQGQSGFSEEQEKIRREWLSALPEFPLDHALLRYASYIRKEVVSLCPHTQSQEEVRNSPSSPANG